MPRDDFSKALREAVAKRAGHLCSRPDCRAQTVGPHSDPTKATTVGIAAHLTAAAPGGPRYDVSLTRAERRGIENALWLCATHAREVDADFARFTVQELRAWKAEAEREAGLDLGHGSAPRAARLSADLAKASQRDQRISRLKRLYPVIGAQGLALEISTFNDLSQTEKAKLFDTVRALWKGGRPPKQNPFRTPA